jgi:hypothetical protein
MTYSVPRLLEISNDLTLGHFLARLLVSDCSFRAKSMPSTEIASYKPTPGTDRPLRVWITWGLPTILELTLNVQSDRF